MTAPWKMLITPEEAGTHMGALPAALRAQIEPTITDGRVADTDRLCQLLQGQDAVVLDLERITDDVLIQCPNVRVISRFGEGCDAIDVAAAAMRGVHVTRTQGVASEAVARHAVTLLLALTHQVTRHDTQLKQGQWVRQHNGSHATITVGIAGYGRIGRATARLARALGFSVVIWSRRPVAECQRVNTIAELCAVSDIISLHLALSGETEGLISRELLFAHLREKQLVNTARGGLVDEVALLDALEQGVLLGYATDVFGLEPVQGISQQIAQHERVIASPHVAAYDQDTARQMTVRAIENAMYGLQEQHERVNAFVTPRPLGAHVI